MNRIRTTGSETGFFVRFLIHSLRGFSIALVLFMMNGCADWRDDSIDIAELYHDGAALSTGKVPVIPGIPMKLELRYQSGSDLLLTHWESVSLNGVHLADGDQADPTVTVTFTKTGNNVLKFRSEVFWNEYKDREFTVYVSENLTLESSVIFSDYAENGRSIQHFYAENDSLIWDAFSADNASTALETYSIDTLAFSSEYLSAGHGYSGSARLGMHPVHYPDSELTGERITSAFFMNWGSQCIVNYGGRLFVDSNASGAMEIQFENFAPGNITAFADFGNSVLFYDESTTHLYRGDFNMDTISNIQAVSSLGTVSWKNTFYPAYCYKGVWAFVDSEAPETLIYTVDQGQSWQTRAYNGGEINYLDDSLYIENPYGQYSTVFMKTAAGEVQLPYKGFFTATDRYLFCYEPVSYGVTNGPFLGKILRNR